MLGASGGVSSAVDPSTREVTEGIIEGGAASFDGGWATGMPWGSPASSTESSASKSRPLSNLIRPDIVLRWRQERDGEIEGSCESGRGCALWTEPEGFVLCNIVLEG